MPSSTQGECAKSLSGAVWVSVSMADEASSMDCDDQDDSKDRKANGRTNQVELRKSKETKKQSGGGTMRRSFRGRTMANNACSTNPPGRPASLYRSTGNGPGTAMLLPPRQ